MKQQPFFYYNSRKEIQDFKDINQYRLNHGSIFLSNSDADKAADIYPSGYIYKFKISSIPRSGKFVRDTSDYDYNKILQIIRNAPTYQTIIESWEGEQHLIKAVLSRSRQGAIYNFIFETMYLDYEYDYANNMKAMGWVGFGFKVTEPDLIGGSKPNHVKTVVRLWNPDYLQLVGKEEWAA